MTKFPADKVDKTHLVSAKSFSSFNTRTFDRVFGLKIEEVS
jgi:hypothetical protein